MPDKVRSELASSCTNRKLVFYIIAKSYPATRTSIRKACEELFADCRKNTLIYEYVTERRNRLGTGLEPNGPFGKFISVKMISILGAT